MEAVNDLHYLHLINLHLEIIKLYFWINYACMWPTQELNGRLSIIFIIGNPQHQPQMPSET